MTILVVITISNVACSCSHYNFDMPDITSRLVILYVLSVIIDKVRLPPQQDDCHEWSLDWKDCTTSFFSSLLLLNRWSWIYFPGKIMDWVAQWMLPEMATTNISGPMNDLRHWSSTSKTIVYLFVSFSTVRHCLKQLLYMEHWNNYIDTSCIPYVYQVYPETFLIPI